MKGERIIAEALSICGLVIYVVLFQHMYAEMFHEPDKSWVNQIRAWWVTRHSRGRIAKLERTWSTKDSAIEPTPGEPA
jgi:hypothetical protein